MYKSEQLVIRLKYLIEQGTWRAGDKLPSLRQQTQYSGFSLITVLNAYQELQAQGLIYAKHKSGYFVADPAVPEASNETQQKIEINSIVFNYLQATRAEHIVAFGSAFPDSQLLYDGKLIQLLAQRARLQHRDQQTPNLPPGHLELRKLIAQRYAMQGIATDPDDLVITSGGLDALNLALQALTHRGDYILLQQHSFYGAWQAAERLGLHVITLPEHAELGFDLLAFEQALQNYPVKVCWFMLNSQNPMGYTVNATLKQQIYQRLDQYQVYLIEDDVYEELYFTDKKPIAIKYFDQQQRVLHCGSFSKTLGASFRVGWVHAGRFSEQIQHLQLMSTLSVNPLIQETLAAYLAHRYYEKHLKQLRHQLQTIKQQYIHYLQQHLASDCQLIHHASGYFLWIILPSRLCCNQIYHHLLSQHISIAPSTLFNAQQQQDNALRLNCSFAFNSRILQALKQLIDALQAPTQRIL